MFLIRKAPFLPYFIPFLNRKDVNQQEKVKSFFNNISFDYKSKYNNANPFLSYFFHQRLNEATHDISFHKKEVLDIGAGTGAVYHFIKSKTTDFNYTAVDISSKMLKQSGIPTYQYFVGDISNFPSSEEKYNYIFLLGVTTYFSRNILVEHLSFISKNLHPEGLAIVSFTNRKSLDFKIRRCLRYFMRLLNFKKTVLGQSFDIFAYSTTEIKQISSDKFSIQKTTYLNQTLPPFNRLFPKTSIAFGNFFKRKVSSPTLLSWISSDFLIFIKKKDQ